MSSFQLRVYKKHTHIPNELIGIVSQDTFEKARLYALDNSYFGLVHEVITVALTLALLSYDFIYVLWSLGGDTIKYFGYEADGKHETLQSAAFITIVMLISTLINIPFKVYKIFVIEEKFGFNKQVCWICNLQLLVNYALLLIYILYFL